MNVIEKNFPSDDDSLIFVDKPTKIQIAGDLNKRYVYEWHGLEIGHIEGKGVGVIASQDLMKGQSYPYGGKIMTIKEYEILVKNPARIGSDALDYLVSFDFGLRNKKGHNTKIIKIHIDGHYRHCDDDNIWPGTKCNEESGSQAFNAILIVVEDSTGIPEYDHIDNKYPLFVVLLRDLKKGEEILLDYGWLKRTYRNKGYLPYRFTNLTSQETSSSLFKRSSEQNKIVPLMLKYKHKQKRKRFTPRKKRS